MGVGAGESRRCCENKKKRGTTSPGRLCFLSRDDYAPRSHSQVVHRNLHFVDQCISVLWPGGRAIKFDARRNLGSPRSR